LIRVIVLAEFCLDCWNRINETNDSEEKYIISKDLDFCDGCCEWKHVIVAERKHFLRKRILIALNPSLAFECLKNDISTEYFFYKYNKELRKENKNKNKNKK